MLLNSLAFVSKIADELIIATPLELANPLDKEKYALHSLDECNPHTIELPVDLLPPVVYTTSEWLDHIADIIQWGSDKYKIGKPTLYMMETKENNNNKLAIMWVRSISEYNKVTKCILNNDTMYDTQGMDCNWFPEFTILEFDPVGMEIIAYTPEFQQFLPFSSCCIPASVESSGVDTKVTSRLLKEMGFAIAVKVRDLGVFVCKKCIFMCLLL